MSMQHTFLWDGKNQITKEYHDQLFKEYCISDLTYYAKNQVALRWRTKKEVISGKGESVCGDRKCDSIDELKTWEVNFKYIEKGNKINTLVKLRLCKECSIKLNFCKIMRKAVEKKNYNKYPETIVQNKINSTIQDCKDRSEETFLWNTTCTDKIDIDINGKIENYLKDLFQYYESY